jgi:hypothetical protein
MGFGYSERWYFATPLEIAKQTLSRLGVPWEIIDVDDDEETMLIAADDRAALESLFARLALSESEILDEDGAPIAFASFEFELQCVKDWDGPFEWILEAHFFDEDMDLDEWLYLRAVAGAIADKLGGIHEEDRSGDDIIAEGHMWAPPPPIIKRR